MLIVDYYSFRDLILKKLRPLTLENVNILNFKRVNV
jgi:hypothetical protein